MFSILQQDDLARMYRLFSRIPKGLDPVADAFKKHVESEGSRLVKEVTEAANQKKDTGAEIFPEAHNQANSEAARASSYSTKDLDVH